MSAETFLQVEGEDTLPRVERSNNTHTKNLYISKLQSGTNVTARSRATEGPLWSAERRPDACDVTREWDPPPPALVRCFPGPHSDSTSRQALSFFVFCFTSAATFLSIAHILTGTFQHSTKKKNIHLKHG